MKYFKIIMTFLVTSICCYGQTLNNQVINSAGGGGTVGTSGVEVYYNIGETVINSIQSASNTVTQGFLQPDVLGNFGLVVSSAINNISCAGNTDGGIILSSTVTGLGASTNVNYQYFWSNNVTCSTNNCSSVSGLQAGTYSVTIIATYGTNVDSVKISGITILDSNAPCLITYFNGLTPNGDGQNDYFHINNIDQYPENMVTIYTRWGQEVARIKNYDNVNRSWSGNLYSGHIAPSGTYFFIIELGPGITPIKGWIELFNK